MATIVKATMTETRTRVCPVCGSTFALKVKGAHRRFCSERCRVAAHRERHQVRATHTAGRGANRAALEEMFVASGIPVTRPDLVQAARSLADAVDGEPRNSGLWGQYLKCLGELAPLMIESEDDAFMALLKEINAANPALAQLEDSAGR